MGKQMQSMESRMESFGSNMESSMKSAFDTSKDFDFDKDFKMQSLNLKDEHEMKIVSDNDKLEISLDTAGQGIVVIEAKHEERTQAGEVMVSRHMKRSYPLPSNSKPEEVVSNLSKDGVLIVTVPKMQSIKQEDRNVPIQMKN